MTIMADEIRQTRRSLATSSNDRGSALSERRRRGPPSPAAVGLDRRPGTSDHAAIYARYLIETQLGWPVGLASPSVTTIYRAPTDWSDGLVLAVSQSGRSPDLVAVVEAARRGGALTVAVTNVAGSPLERAAAHTVPCRAGEERAVAATKSYVAELAAVAGIVATLAPESDLAGSLVPSDAGSDARGGLGLAHRATARSLSTPWRRPAGRSSSHAGSTWPRPSRPPSS